MFTCKELLDSFESMDDDEYHNILLQEALAHFERQDNETDRQMARRLILNHYDEFSSEFINAFNHFWESHGFGIDSQALPNKPWATKADTAVKKLNVS